MSSAPPLPPFPIANHDGDHPVAEEDGGCKAEQQQRKSVVVAALFAAAVASTAVTTKDNFCVRLLQVDNKSSVHPFWCSICGAVSIRELLDLLPVTQITLKV